MIATEKSTNITVKESTTCMRWYNLKTCIIATDVVTCIIATESVSCIVPTENVPQHIHNELIKLNGIEFQNHCIRIKEARTTKQTQEVLSNKQNRPNSTRMPRENDAVIFDTA